jgi:hypothetical protein
VTREVDLDNITPEDAAYMRQRPWLINEARLRGVDDIEDRLVEAEEYTPEETAAISVRSYEDLELPALKKVAQARGLEAKGGKAKVVERLREQDAARGGISAEAEGALAILQGKPDPNEPANPESDEGTVAVIGTRATGDNQAGASIQDLAGEQPTTPGTDPENPENQRESE